MKRGGTGKPWRKPAGGWKIPSQYFQPPLYRHVRPSLNGYTKFVNSTDNLPLQQNQYGPPVSRPAVVDMGEYSCEQAINDNGLPKIPWIGLGDNQYLFPQLRQKFNVVGTTDFGASCRERGGKWAQFCRQFHGVPGWTSHDPSGCADVLCLTEIDDLNGNHPGSHAGDPGQNSFPGSGSPADWVPTYSTRKYEAAQLTPDQTNYLAVDYELTFSDVDSWSVPYAKGEVYGTATGGFSVDPQSGKKTNSLVTTEQNYYTYNGGGHPRLKLKDMNGGTGFEGSVGFDGTTDIVQNIVNYAGNGSSAMDIAIGDVHCGNHVLVPTNIFGGGSPITIEGQIEMWNGVLTGRDNYLPPVTDQNNYSGTATTGAVGSGFESIDISWTRTATTYTFSFVYHLENFDASQTWDVSFTGTITLSNLNTSADVKSDGEYLLSFWPLNDDAIYPWRTDGIWQVAPLMTRDEVEYNVSPLLGFTRHTVDDLRAPIADANGNAAWTSIVNPPPLGWTYSPTNNATANFTAIVPSDADHPAVAWVPTYTQMAWFDPSAYGFKFAFGRTVNDSSAIDFLQYALTGKIYGMPMPAAFTNAESALYDAAFTVPAPPAKYNYENFFDFRAKLWQSCDHVNGDGAHSIDTYIAGYGEWLNDAIARTGAQLPRCATQWTNNVDALSKGIPYAYLIQADPRIVYSPPDAHANRADALWGQKCCEVEEIWPSYNFFRPAAADKFSYDETQVYCVTNLSGAGAGSTWTLVNAIGDTPADGLDVSGTWGGSSVGGFYTGCSYAGGVLTLGTLVANVPSDWLHALNGDEGTCIGKLRYPTAPAILGRAHVTDVADLGAVRQLTTENLTALGLGVTTPDYVDICDAAMNVLAGGMAVTRVDDTHFTVGTALATIANAKYILTTGAPDWSWDDNGRKGDFVILDWLFDYRTPAEIARLAGATDCAGGSVALSPTTAGYLGFATFDQTQHQLATGLPFLPCCPAVIAITPNGETWTNGVVIPFPTTFNFDARYGARWQSEIEQAMADLLWQAPAKPCGSNPCNQWKSDDGTCREDGQPIGFDCGDGSGVINYYGHSPMVEARVSVPNYGGALENLTAPTPPTGIGYLSPVTNAGGLQPPDKIGFDIGTGNPTAAFTIWGYRFNIEQSDCAPNSCRFHYAAAENLLCLDTSAPTNPTAPSDGNTADGMTNEGLT